MSLSYFSITSPIVRGYCGRTENVGLLLLHWCWWRKSFLMWMILHQELIGWCSIANSTWCIAFSIERDVSKYSFCDVPVHWHWVWKLSMCAHVLVLFFMNREMSWSGAAGGSEFLAGQTFRMKKVFSRILAITMKWKGMKTCKNASAGQIHIGCKWDHSTSTSATFLWRFSRWCPWKGRHTPQPRHWDLKAWLHHLVPVSSENKSNILLSSLLPLVDQIL